MNRWIVAATVAAALAAAPFTFASRPAGAQTTTTTQAKPKRATSAAQQAMRERQKKCGVAWKADKAAGKIEKGMTWPKYWSACNKRLKAGG